MVDLTSHQLKKEPTTLCFWSEELVQEAVASPCCWFGRVLEDIPSFVVSLIRTDVDLCQRLHASQVGL